MIKIKSVSKVNPQDITLPAKFYAQIISAGKTGIEELTELVSDGSTVRENDIHAVVIGLVNVIINELKKGRSVEFGTLGTFKLSVNSEGSATTDEVNTGNIKKTKILYRPGKKLQKLLKVLDFTKVQSP